jgi:hypothetical protein
MNPNYGLITCIVDVFDLSCSASLHFGSTASRLSKLTSELNRKQIISISKIRHLPRLTSDTNQFISFYHVTLTTIQILPHPTLHPRSLNFPSLPKSILSTLSCPPSPFCAISHRHFPTPLRDLNPHILNLPTISLLSAEK